MNANWTRWLPPFITARLREQPAFSNILNNTFWLVLDKGATIIAGLLVGAWVARYLGPERLGILSYAMAFAAITSTFARLGLRDIVIRNTVRTPAEKNEILGTNLVLQFVAGVTTIIFTILLANVTNSGDSLTIMLIAIIALGMLFRPFSHTVEFWFHSKVQAKYYIWSRNIVLLIISATRVGLILSGASLSSFAWVILLDDVLIGIILLIAYHMSGERLRELRFAYRRALQLLRDSWPLMFAVLASVIYLRIDQIMLGQMVNSTELGYYSAAVRVSELWYFLPSAMAISAFPAIIHSQQGKEAAVYRKRLQLFYDVIVGASYLIVIPLVLLATPLVILLFGPEFAPSGPILTVHAWAFIFISIGVARSRWLLAENLVRFTLLATALGAIVNLAVNFFLIPRYAGLGAAWATVIAYGVSAYFSSLLTRQSRLAFRQSSLALLMPVRLLWERPKLRELM